MLLGLQAWAEFCYTGGMDRGTSAAGSASCTGADGRALARISAFNKTPLLDAESDLPNAAKFLLYQDPLLGLYDLDIEGLGLCAALRLAGGGVCRVCAGGRPVDAAVPFL